MLRSQNGWPLVHPDDAPRRIRAWVIPGQQRSVSLPLLGGAFGFVLAHWALWFDRQIEDIQEPPTDDWGYAYRPIGDTGEWSNHASATAIDLNALIHSYGTPNTFSPEQEADMVDRLEGTYRSAIRAGFTYQGTPDDMHFEYVQGKRLVKELANDLFDTPNGRRLREANPWMTWVPKGA